MSLSSAFSSAYDIGVPPPAPGEPCGPPDLQAVKTWLGLPADDTVDDTLIQQSLDASIAQQSRICVYPCDENNNPCFDADLYEAVLLRTLRLMNRRSSPESIVGITGTSGDFVGARLPSVDADVVRLESPWLKVVVS